VDAVCGFHVLEHTDDPREFLASAQAALVPGGWLALEVPNIDSHAARRQGGSWPSLLLEYHRWHFSPLTLLRLVESSGFLVRKCDTVFARYYARPLRQLCPSGLATLVADWRVAKSPRVAHSRWGENIRLLVQLPKGSPNA
jgi:SAM-dependent methyltransferase